MLSHENALAPSLIDKPTDKTHNFTLFNYSHEDATDKRKGKLASCSCGYLIHFSYLSSHTGGVENLNNAFQF